MTRPREAQLTLLLTISEGLCRGTDEMLTVSPKGDAIHPPSCGLAIREAVEEIKWLRAQVERLSAALRWYADLTNYVGPVVSVFDPPPALLDKGALARETLEGKL